MPIPITARGAEKLKAELQRLKAVDRPTVIQAIKDAREKGDLSENAEYDAARERQGFIEGRIQELEGKVSSLQIIDPTTVDAAGRIVFGATVELEDQQSGEVVKYQIVGDDEADIKAGMISVSSPIARALIGRSEGDMAQVARAGRDARIRGGLGRVRIASQLAGLCSAAAAPVPRRATLVRPAARVEAPGSRRGALPRFTRSASRRSAVERFGAEGLPGALARGAGPIRRAGALGERSPAAARLRTGRADASDLLLRRGAITARAACRLIARAPLKALRRRLRTACRVLRGHRPVPSP